EERAIESRAHALHRDARREQGREAVAQCNLVVGEFEVHYRGSRGRPSTRSPMMFRWICDAPAAIVSASVRRRSSTSSLSSMCNAPRLRAFMHTSPKRWRASEYASFMTIAPGPVVPRDDCET